MDGEGWEVWPPLSRLGDSGGALLLDGAMDGAKGGQHGTSGEARHGREMRHGQRVRSGPPGHALTDPPVSLGMAPGLVTRSCSAVAYRSRAQTRSARRTALSSPPLARREHGGPRLELRTFVDMTPTMHGIVRAASH